MSSDAYVLMLLLDVSICRERPDFQEFQDPSQGMSKILIFHDALFFTISFNIRAKAVKTVSVYNVIFFLFRRKEHLSYPAYRDSAIY